MKIAVIKIGARISFSSVGTSGGTGEALSIIKMLKKGGLSVDVYTKILDKDKNPKDIQFFDIETEYPNINSRGYQGLIVINGHCNFFGGAEARDQVLNYHLINNFKGRVFYIYCDPSLQLTQLWGAIEKKPWGEKYKKQDIEISRTDIVYISQPYDIPAVEEIINKNGIKAESIVHFPFEKFPCLNDKIKIKDNPTYDLLYGGTMRGNKRIDKMIKFYFGYSMDINVEMFGKIDDEELIKRANKLKILDRPPRYGTAIKYDAFMEKMNDTIAHVVIGDKWYEGKDMAQRCYESIWSSVITFIDLDLDPQMRVFGKNINLQKFNYVSSKDEVEKRIKLLKDNKKLRQQIIEEQFKTIDFNADVYCKEFTDIIKQYATEPQNEPITTKTKTLF